MRSVLCKLLFRTNADQLIHFVDANRGMRTFWMQHLWVFLKKKVVSQTCAFGVDMLQ